MKKHAFLIRWAREGRSVGPVLDMHAECVWPLGPEDNDVLSAKALVAMIGGYDNLPKDVKSFMHAYHAMQLRLRYSNGDTTGPYLMNDDEEVHNAESIDQWLASASDEEISRYHHKAGRVNRARKG
jgi:hypothetical protein